MSAKAQKKPQASAPTETGAGVARTAPYTVTILGYVSSPRPIAAMGRGNLLFVVRRQQSIGRFINLYTRQEILTYYWYREWGGVNWAALLVKKAQKSKCITGIIFSASFSLLPIS